MTTTPTNPKIAAIRQDAEISYGELDQLIDESLAVLPPEKLYQPPAENEWTIMENLAHVVEFMPYWADQIEQLVAEPGRNFGRVATDERRIKEIADHAHDSLQQIKAMLPGSYNRLQETLAKLNDSDLEITGQHPRYGKRTLEWFIDDFVTGHLRAHNEQIRQCMNAEG